MSAQKQSPQINPPNQSNKITEKIISSLKPAHNDAHFTSPEAEFQKNYPKNIFIPLIEYLSEVGYKQAYEQCVGCRSDFEGKNVVPLSSIYTLINQDWFRRNINKQNLLAHISNKILINSKIKKKLFHLLIAQLILMADYTDMKDFKRRISKEANLIAQKPLPQDDVFSYPNAVIYLLHLFLKILLFHANKKGYNKLEVQFSKLSLQEQPAAEAKSKNLGSKEQYKLYVKQIVHIFSGKGLIIQNLTDILEQIRIEIMEKDKQLREKYQLIEGIPNWIIFAEIVVMRCFEYKRKDMKITNFLFNEWIIECKNKMQSIESKVDAKSTQKDNNNWEPSPSLEWGHKGMEFNNQNWNALPKLAPVTQGPSIQSISVGESHPILLKGIAKQFSPIIISKNAGK